MGPLLSARQVSKRLTDRLVLRDVTFDVNPGEVLAVLGPNGAGKSTLLKVLAGIWTPTSGQLLRFGEPVRSDPADRRIGYVGHRSLLYRPLSGMENLEFYGRLYGIPNPRAAAERAMRRVGMRRFQSDPVHRYSRGMEQRTAIARAFLHDPLLLLLDEPYTSLDVEARAILEEMVGETVRQGGGAVLITHQLDEAERLGRRAASLWAGRLRPLKEAETNWADARETYRKMFHVGRVGHGP